MTFKTNLSGTAATALLALCGTSAAMAASNVDYLSVNLGEYNALRDNQQSFQYGLEYRFAEWSYGVRPMVGAFGTADGAAYGYAGLNWDVAIIPDQLYIIPNFAAGAYRNGGGKDLGGTVEFRSGIELSYQFENQHQLGIALNHLSNAGIYDHNPGEESIFVTYSVPVRSLF